MATRKAPGKLVLCVIDALTPAALERAIADGATPTLARLRERGHYLSECVASFPSVTPVCAASITTGRWQDGHGVPGMNWYDRDQQRYVEYGSSFRAAQRFGIARQLTDTIYNLNQAHLNPALRTVFEALDDAEVRTAGTTYLIYRGRHVHEPRRAGLLSRLASPLARHSVLGPRELFYADLFASRPAPCTAMLGMPGLRDRHSGCVGEYLVEHDLFDFLLLSLPDNDWYSHRHGPQAQMHSLADADRQLTRVMDAAGGVDEFLEDHAVIVMGDHAQVPIDRTIDLAGELAGLGISGPGKAAAAGPLAVCPSQRAAMVYILEEDRSGSLAERLRARVREIEGVELLAWLERDAAGAPAEAVLCNPLHGELRFAPGGSVVDRRGRAWCLEGHPEALALKERDGRLDSSLYPDALDRLWAALTCPRSGDLLLSASPRHEFLDWGGQAHPGGGSHGSLRAGDSLTGVIITGVKGPSEEPGQWTICDVARLAAGHFGAELDQGGGAYAPAGEA